MGTDSNGNSPGWRIEVLRWAANQGPVTIILFLILWGGYRIANYAIDVAIPAHLHQIQAGYETIEAKQADRFRALTDTLTNESEKNREVLSDVIDELKRRGNQ